MSLDNPDPDMVGSAGPDIEATPEQQRKFDEEEAKHLRKWVEKWRAGHADSELKAEICRREATMENLAQLAGVTTSQLAAWIADKAVCARTDLGAIVYNHMTPAHEKFTDWDDPDLPEETRERCVKVAHAVAIAAQYQDGERLKDKNLRITHLQNALRAISTYSPKREDCDPTIPDDPYVKGFGGCKRLAREALNS